MKKSIILCALCLLGWAASAQSAAAISDLLAKKTATLTDFSYLIASQSGLEYTPFEAYDFCDRFDSFGLESGPETPITYQTASYFFMINYGMRGGIMWSMARSPRYAWKELKSANFWKGVNNPDATMSGQTLIRSINRFFTRWPDVTLRKPPLIEASNRYRQALLGEEKNDNEQK